MKRFWSFLFFLVPIGGVATFIVCALLQYLAFPRDVSEHGRTIDSLFMFILYLTGAVFVVTELVLFYFMWKYDGEIDATSQ